MIYRSIVWSSTRVVPFNESLLYYGKAYQAWKEAIVARHQNSVCGHYKRLYGWSLYGCGILKPCKLCKDMHSLFFFETPTFSFNSHREWEKSCIGCIVWLFFKCRGQTELYWNSCFPENWKHQWLRHPLCGCMLQIEFFQALFFSILSALVNVIDKKQLTYRELREH